MIDEALTYVGEGSDSGVDKEAGATATLKVITISAMIMRYS